MINHMVFFYFFSKEIKMSYTKRYLEEKIEEIMNTFSGEELVEKLRATFGYSDAEIANTIIDYGTQEVRKCS